mmetsp:Transcript_21700/g.30362  ORF Transcript_21700/g.30362 Transcript_21700/m.30362 type:complete len:202 (+) Transcript_21700:498-1103(+)|eukprot:CAMPEP_0168560152 /NCGR_PEP_ID=MMETSP0413-20121227/10906_1 /TAXON_ID=136452 /ORGANISM="Filamoeba nolandi, Strain NC-AS-23-1" /LENGTH=201 /DNA_ID=CAMNT_0008591431 /DNA_START=450 /DNA_END=1055 /DNA_ORIENTATION=+
MESNQVDRTLYILNNTSTPCQQEDVQLLQQLRAQFSLYCSNLQADGDTSEFVLKLSNSLPYLSKRIASYYRDSNNNNNNETSDNGITCAIEHGTLAYFLDGKRIKFKVPKNKPKNGDFKIRWNRSFEDLKKYYAKYRSTRVTRTTPGYKDLGNWVAEQRRKLKKGKVTLEQFQALNEIGFEWDRSSYFFNTYKQKKEENEE